MKKNDKNAGRRHDLASRDRNKRGGRSANKKGIIELNDDDTGVFMEPPRPGKKKTQTITGTEEILDDEGPSFSQNKDVTKSKKKDDKPTYEDEEVELYNSMITKTRQHNVFKFPKINMNICEYSEIWKESIDSSSDSHRVDYGRPDLVKKPAIPFPFHQPASYLNRFSLKKLTSDKKTDFGVYERRDEKLLFSKPSTENETEEIKNFSKLAGNIMKKIFNQDEGYTDLFLMQIPNSISIFNNENMCKIKDEDINLSKQSNNDCKIDLTAPIFVNNVTKQRTLPQSLVLTNFDYDKPFGKIQLLKSGKLVMKIGNRRFDIITTNNDCDPNMATIIDFDGVTTRKADSSASKPVIYTCGKIKNSFSVHYNYESIFNDLQPLVLNPKSKPTESIKVPEKVVENEMMDPPIKESDVNMKTKKKKRTPKQRPNHSEKTSSVNKSNKYSLRSRK